MSKLWNLPYIRNGVVRVTRLLVQLTNIAVAKLAHVTA